MKSHIWTALKWLALTVAIAVVAYVLVWCYVNLAAYIAK